MLKNLRSQITFQKIFQVILIVSVLSFAFWNLGSGSLKPWDEALTGERVREMVSNGDFLTPHLFGEPDYNKPPLYYLLSAPVYYLVGQDEFGIRFWSVAFAVGCAILAYFCVVSSGLKRTWGVLAALLLLANPHWQNWTRMGLLDSGFALSVLASLRLLSIKDLSRQQALWGGIILGAGSLLKSPLVLLAIPCVIAANLLRYRRLQWRNLLLATGVAVAIVLAWSLLQFVSHGQDWIDFQKYNFVDRFTSNVEGHSTSSWVYWNQLMTQVKFQTFLFFSAIFGAAFISPRGFRRCAPEIIFLLGWVALMTISASKRTTYLLPAYPFVAVITATLLGEMLKDSRRIFVAVFVICLSFMNMADHYEFTLDYSPHMAKIGYFVNDNPIVDGFLETSVQEERQVLAFYAQHNPGRIRKGDLQKWAREKKQNPDNGGYLVVSKGETNITLAALISDLHSVYDVEIAIKNKRFSAIRLLPISEDPSVQIFHTTGWLPSEKWGRWAVDESVKFNAFSVPFPSCLVVNAASWKDGQDPIEFEVFIDGEKIGTMEFDTVPWKWQDKVLRLPGSGTKTIEIEFRFLKRFQDPNQGRWRSLPISGIRIEQCSEVLVP